MEIDLERVEAERERIKQTYFKEPPDRPQSAARGIHHTALLSSDVERTVRFYQEVLEFPLIEIFENRDYRGIESLLLRPGERQCPRLLRLSWAGPQRIRRGLGRLAPHRHLGRTGKLGTAEAQPRGCRRTPRDPQRGLALLQGPRRGAPRTDRRPAGRNVRDALARLAANPGLGSTAAVAANPGLVRG